MAALVVIVGVIGIVVGVLYLTQPVHALPSFFPGYRPHVPPRERYIHRGEAAIGVGAVVIVVGLASGLLALRRRRFYYS